MEIKHICFECEGAKWYWIPHDDEAPTQEPCSVCNGVGDLVYDEAQIQYFFPDYVLPQAIEPTESPSASEGRIGSGGSHE